MGKCRGANRLTQGLGEGGRVSPAGTGREGIPSVGFRGAHQSTQA